MLLKKISVAAAGLALIASGPVAAANSAPNLLVSAAAVAQGQGQGQDRGRGNDDAGERSGFERYFPGIVVVVFTIVFIYFLLDSQENEEFTPSPSPPPTSP